MKSLKSRLLAGVMGLLLSTSVFAYDKNDEQTIRQDITQMQNAIQNKDGNAGQVVVDMMPEPIFKEMAKTLDLSVSDMKELMVGMAGGMSELEIQFQADLDKIQVHQSETGRDYAFIPTVTTTEGIEVKGKLFAVKDNGKWFYLNWQNQDRYKSWIKKAYPDIKKLP